MVGAITARDILAHPIATIQCFGWRLFFRAITSWGNQNFLSLLEQDGFFRAAPKKVPAILDRCIDLELRAKQLYENFAATFDHQSAAGEIFAGLAVQEQYHADLLNVCRAAAIRKGWKAQLFNPWESYLPRLEEQMAAVEAAASRVLSIEDALRLVIQIESSEINVVFQAAVAATDSAFVKRLKPFREAMEAHMAHIAERLPELCPPLWPACRELRSKFSRVRN